MLALSHTVTRRTPSRGAPGRRRASAKAKRATRSTPLRVITSVSVTTSPRRFTPAPRLAYRPSVFSRTIT
jgi:hypothetical protein